MKYKPAVKKEGILHPKAILKILKDNYLVRPVLNLGEAQYITDIVD